MLKTIDFQVNESKMYPKSLKCNDTGSGQEVETLTGLLIKQLLYC